MASPWTEFIYELAFHMNEPVPEEMARRMPAQTLDRWWVFLKRRRKRIQAEAEGRTSRKL